MAVVEAGLRHRDQGIGHPLVGSARIAGTPSRWAFHDGVQQDLVA